VLATVQSDSCDTDVYFFQSDIFHDSVLWGGLRLLQHHFPSKGPFVCTKLLLFITALVMLGSPQTTLLIYLLQLLLK